MRTAAQCVLGLALAIAAPGCNEPNDIRQMDTVLVDLSLTAVSPTSWIPGTQVAAEGDAFVDDPWGTSRLRLRGSSDRATGIDVSLPLSFGSFERLDTVIEASVVDALGGNGAKFEGNATVEVISAVDGSTYSSAPLDLQIVVNDFLTPQLDTVETGGIIFPNEKIDLGAFDLLLAGEGQTLAVVAGCFAPLGTEECTPVAGAEVPVNVNPDRDGGWFAFSPRIAGIEPGHFEGTVSLRNVHDSGDLTASADLPVVYDLTEPILYGASTDRATLGQFVDIDGAGFVGNGEGDTVLQFAGNFASQDGVTMQPFDVVLVPEFVDGQTVRYVVSETDSIAQAMGSFGLTVRYSAGTFEGLVTPETSYGDQTVLGDPTPFAFSLQPVKQIVYVEFLPSYTESLRHFGVRAVDQMIRERVFAVLQRDYATLGVEFRDSEPTDYALYAEVEVGGPDPNGLGLLGYDNTPGKDTENQRLYDRIGGVNALTQEDGYPGFGGVFIESLLGYSSDPAGYAQPIEPNEAFDAVFDPFRLERGGTPVMASDLADGVPTLSSGDSCPTTADDRRLQLSCAIWALGNMVGTTVSHEIGHSLGLADPYGPAFHNTGDAPNRLMDADRPFEERAQIGDAGYSLFCVDEYDYLRAILPTDADYDPTARPVCF